MTHTIALVGDYSSAVPAHRAIPEALKLASEAAGTAITWQWVSTVDVCDAPRDLDSFSGVWVVPASPYASMEGALSAIRFAREARRPFLGTCGGFQHALIEFARNVAGLSGADHAETNPNGEALVITPLACSLVEQTAEIRFAPNSLIKSAYARDRATEGYHCNYGVNDAYRTKLETAGLRFTAFDSNGDIRAAELPPTTHPFFVGTLFQPERAALRGQLPPLVRAFAAAVVSRSP